MGAIRRLRSVAAAVSADSGKADDATLLEAQLLAAENRLVPAAFSKDVIRELMVAGGRATEGAKVQRVSGTTETERRLAVEMPSDIELGAPPQPLIDSMGRVSAEQMARLGSLEATAAREGRYEDASYLQRLQRVVDPHTPQLSYDDCAPESPEDAAEFFLQHGFVVIKGAMAPDRLARVQGAWESFAGPAREAWVEHKKHCHGIARHYHDVPTPGKTSMSYKSFSLPLTRS